MTAIELHVQEPEGKARVVEVHSGLTIGRDATNELSLNDQKVSRRHCEVCELDGRLHLRDMGSRGTTRIHDGKTGECTRRLSKDETCLLEPGVVIRVGDTEIKVLGAREDDVTIQTGVDSDQVLTDPEARSDSPSMPGAGSAGSSVAGMESDQILTFQRMKSYDPFVAGSPAKAGQGAVEGAGRPADRPATPKDAPQKPVADPAARTAGPSVKPESRRSAQPAAVPAEKAELPKRVPSPPSAAPEKESPRNAGEASPEPGTERYGTEEVRGLNAMKKFGPRLLVLGHANNTVHEVDKNPWIIGRGPAANLSLPLKEISERHAQIRFSGGTFRVADLGSTNGTFVQPCASAQEEPVPPESEVEIADETVIRLGEIDMFFYFGRPVNAEERRDLHRRALDLLVRRHRIDPAKRKALWKGAVDQHPAMALLRARAIKVTDWTEALQEALRGSSRMPRSLVFLLLGLLLAIAGGLWWLKNRG